MTETTATGPGQARPAFPQFDFAKLAEINGPALSAIAEINSKLCEALIAMNREWVGFVNRRFEEDAAMPQYLARCKSAHDMYEVYADFFQRAYNQYQTQFEQFTKLGRTLAGDTVHLMQDRFEKAAQDMAER
jgi:hypothetical protein